MRQQLQNLPGSPAQATQLAALEGEAEELTSKAARLHAKTVPRPNPPQYTQIMQSVQHFLTSLGGVQRLQSLLTRLQVRHC